MYSSDSFTDIQPFSWGQPQPQQHSKPSNIFCNGHPTKQRHWRQSRETHRNMAEYWAICTREVLLALPPECTVIRGCIKYPFRSPIEWKQFKRRFSSLLSRAAKRGNIEIALCSKQHITDKGTDCHFDYIGWTTGKPARVQQSIRQFAKSCGGTATCRIVPRRNVAGCAAYVYKFAEVGTDHLRTFWKHHYLPATGFPCTWVLGKVWRRTKVIVSQTRYWNDGLETVSRPLNGMQQVWREYVRRMYGESIPRFTTAEYRAAVKLRGILSDNKPEVPMTREDWRATLNLASEYPDGVRLAPIHRDGKGTGYWLIEAGGNPSITDRMAGIKPATQQVVNASEADNVRRLVCPKPAVEKPAWKPIPEAPEYLLCCAEDFILLTDAEWEAEMMAL